MKKILSILVAICITLQMVSAQTTKKSTEKKPAKTTKEKSQKAKIKSIR